MIDTESLLAPISEESATGRDLRLEAGDLTFQKIEELRKEVDPAVDPEGRGKEADWPAVLRECESALQKQSKDLQLVAWLLDALTRTEGLPGLLQGLRLLRLVLEKFWDGVHPGLDDGEIVGAVRARPLAWLGGSSEFLAVVSAAPLVRMDGGRTLSWAHFQHSERVDEAATLSDQGRYRELIEAGHMTGEQWRARLASAPAEQLQVGVSTLEGCGQEVEAIGGLCAEKLDADDAPSMIELRDLLAEIREYLEERIPHETGAPAAGGSELAAAPETAPGLPAGPIHSREAALAQLREVAEYFRHAEPHSPVSYLVERAVRWGHMPLEELLIDIIKSDDVLSGIRETLGLSARAETAAGGGDAESGSGGGGDSDW